VAPSTRPGAPRSAAFCLPGPESVTDLRLSSG